MSLTRNRTMIRWPVAGLMAALALLTGCTHFQVGTQSSLHQSAQTEMLVSNQMSQELISFLEAAPEYATKAFESTPWGDDTQLELVERYFSASGKQCVRLSVNSMDNAQYMAGVCRSAQSWHTTAPIVKSGMGPLDGQNTKIWVSNK